MTQDRPLLGVLLMLGFCVLAPFADSLAKLLGDRLALIDLVVLRFAAQAVLIVPIMVVTGRAVRFAPQVWGLIVIRTLLHIAGLFLIFLALRFLPIADAIAIAYVMPFIMLALGFLVLGEEVGPHRLTACAVGFCGTLLVVQPNFLEVGAPALLPLGVAVVFALFQLVTRALAKQVDAISLQGVGGTLATAALLPFAVFDSQPVPTLDPGGWTLVVLLGVAGTVSHLLLTWSLKYAPAATLAPMQYLEIPVATVFGLLMFNDLPNGVAAVGIAVTISAGLYIIARERWINRSGPTPPRPPAARASAK